MVRKNLYKILLTFVVLGFTGISAWASDIDSIINDFSVSENTLVSVSVKDAKNGDVLYEKDSKMLLHPASALKLFTSAAVLDYLGADYEFETAIYQKGTDFYIKLSGDPMMDEKTLANLVSQLRLKEIKSLSSFYIDDSLIDAKSWGEGWMYDDNTSPFFPPFNAYNINHNMIALQVKPGESAKPEVRVFPHYSFDIKNELQNGDSTGIKISRNLFEAPNLLILTGSVSKPTTTFVPVPQPQTLFISRLFLYLEKYGIAYNPEIKMGNVPSRAKKVASVSHTLGKILPEINKVSDNLAAEMIVKHAGAKYSKKTGTTLDGLNVFLKYYDKRGVMPSSIFVVDGSGASHNDLLTTDWMSSALVAISKEKEFKEFIETLAKPKEAGTLKSRLGRLEGSLYAKTGTLAGISSITGYLITKNNEKLVFSIMIQNYKGSSSKAKALEDRIINNIYSSY